MTRFKEGDRVRVRRNLNCHPICAELAGKQFVIESDDRSDRYPYDLVGDSDHSWSQDELELVTDLSPPRKYQVGDKVRYRGKIVTVKYTYSGNDLGFDYVDRSGYENTVGHSQVSAGETQLVTEGGEMPHQRRTFKQLKDSVMVKKDALWQEACDDGTQEYILLDQAFNKDPRQTQRIYDRSLVEGDPKNFVEVFKVSPDYMTREELDQFEAFKKGKTAKAAVVKTEATEFPPSKSTVSNARLEKFVAAWNSSRNLDSLATKLGISIGTVYVYKSAAQRQGKELKTLRRSKKAA